MSGKTCWWLAVLVMGLALGGGCASRKVAPPPSAGKPTPSRAEAPAKGSKPYTVLGRTYQPLASAEGYEEVGLASWYGPNFHGKKTSSGEVYDMEALTAAHKILPLQTWVAVHNLDNGRRATIRVNDRGPFVDGRIIDLSKAAARELGVLGPGTAKVRVTALGFLEPGPAWPARPPPTQPESYREGVFSVQVGSFVNEANATRLAARLRTTWQPVEVVPFDRGDQMFYRVLVGKYRQLDQAEEAEARLRRDGFMEAFARAW